MNLKVSIIIVIVLFNAGLIGSQTANMNVLKKPSENLALRDTLDGAFDLSSRMEGPTGGVVPIPIIITEPAVGYGGGLALVLLKDNKSKSNKQLPSDATGIVGFGTQNKSWAVGIFHNNYINEDKIRYTGGAVYADFNLDFYFNNPLTGKPMPVGMDMKMWGILQEVLFRVAKTRLFIGPEYVFFHTRNKLRDLNSIIVIPGFEDKVELRSNLSVLSLKMEYDTRNSLFTPEKGIITGLTGRYSAEFLGSDHNYALVNPFFTAYVPISKKVFSGYRFYSEAGFLDMPFYAKPFVQLRGVPAVKYQGEKVATVETEWRGFVYRRWSLVGFGGVGKGFDKFDDFNKADWVYSYGAGFRYMLARKEKLHVGIDFAWSNDDFAFYIIFGSFWND